MTTVGRINTPEETPEEKRAKEMTLGEKIAMFTMLKNDLAAASEDDISAAQKGNHKKKLTKVDLFAVPDSVAAAASDSGDVMDPPADDDQDGETKPADNAAKD